MKAITHRKYGSPDVLQLEELQKPSPKENEALIKIHAASVNSWDWDLVRGIPRIYRLLFGILKPKHPIIGCDIGGTVERVGKNVTQFQPGDEVFGDISPNGFGAFAEYACAPENLLALKPQRMSFEEAAALPQAGVLALQGLRHGQVRQGSKILLNGAGGGVGTFAIQLAKLWGAEVTGVDSAAKLEIMRLVGADHVLDYGREDFTKTGQRYDLILDVISNRSLADYRRALNPKGVGVIVGGDVTALLRTAFFGSKFSDKKIELLVHKPNKKDLEELAQLFAEGKLKAVIDKRYPLSETADAVRFLGEGKAKGKIVITMGNLI